MSDEQVPAWVQAMEERLSGRIAESIEALAATLEVRAEARDHHLVTEVTKAINDSEACLTRRLDEIHDDIGVNMARADLEHTKIAKRW
jgi:hypothetical protein